MGDVITFPADRARKVVAQAISKMDAADRMAELRALLRETEARAKSTRDIPRAVELARYACRLRKAIEMREREMELATDHPPGAA